MKRHQLIILLLLTVCIGMFGGWGVARLVNNPDSNGITNISSAVSVGGDFRLNNINGGFDTRDYRGKVLVIYFGFTACPDVCPTSMGVMKQAFKLLSEEELKQVQGLLISLDPERDTLEKVERYAQYFHPNIHGATGSLDDLKAVAKQYGVVFRKVTMENSAIGYTLDHTSIIYIVNQQGQLYDVLEHGSPPAQLAAALRTLIER